MVTIKLQKLSLKYVVFTKGDVIKHALFINAQPQ